MMTNDGKILANERDAYIPDIGKGIIPTDAAKHHELVGADILKKSLEMSGLSWCDIDIISYSCGPGLAPALLVGAKFAIELSKKYKKPLIKVNHCVGHLEIGKLTTGAKDPIFLYLSGGNTQVIAYTEERYRIFGETEDIPIGNCFDVVARELGLQMPGGAKIESLAKFGKKYIPLPYVVKGMDVSYSGITTAAAKMIKSGISKEDIAYSLQETCFAMLTEVTERSLAHTGKSEVLLVGGVAANKRLQEMIKIMCDERSAKFCVVPQEYSGDNGVMMALTGILAYESKWKPKFKDKINPSWRIDEVDVTWV